MKGILKKSNATCKKAKQCNAMLQTGIYSLMDGWCPMASKLRPKQKNTTTHAPIQDADIPTVRGLRECFITIATAIAQPNVFIMKHPTTYQRYPSSPETPSYYLDSLHHPHPV